mgnify:CR=1 FL=1
MSEKILEIRHLSKTFGTNLVLKDIDFTVNSKDVTCIIGASGSGKSTLLRCLNLLETPTTGEILYHGNNIADAKVNAPKYRSRVGMVFQSFNLIDELNVYENVELPLTYLGFKASERRRMVEDILKRMNISHRAKHFPQQLSGGQQQRVAIARAVVTNPKLILADEPTGNLDSKNGAEVMNLLTELNREGTTIIMVTHSQHDASFAHRTIHLFDGSIVASVKA